MAPIRGGSVNTTWKYGTSSSSALRASSRLATLTPGAMPIATAAIGDRRVAARRVRAARDVPAEGRRAAALDRVHHLQLGVGHVTAVGATPSGTVIAEDVRDLQSWTGHCCSALLRLVLLRRERPEPVK